MRKFSFLVLFLLIFSLIGLIKGWHELIGGFKTNKIYPLQDIRSEIAEVPSKLSKDFFKIFDQEFHFLDKGCQVFIFESADKKYVIKFIKHYKYKPFFWMRVFDPFTKINEYKEKYAHLRKERMKRNSYSYRMAYEDLKEITQVVYVHLDTTNYINKKLVLKDRAGQKYLIDLYRS